MQHKTLLESVPETNEIKFSINLDNELEKLYKHPLLSSLKKNIENSILNHDDCEAALKALISFSHTLNSMEQTESLSERNKEIQMQRRKRIIIAVRSHSDPEAFIQGISAIKNKLIPIRGLIHPDCITPIMNYMETSPAPCVLVDMIKQLTLAGLLKDADIGKTNLFELVRLVRVLSEDGTIVNESHLLSSDELTQERFDLICNAHAVSRSRTHSLTQSSSVEEIENKLSEKIAFSNAKAINTLGLNPSPTQQEDMLNQALESFRLDINT